MVPGRLEAWRTREGSDEESVARGGAGAGMLRDPGSLLAVRGRNVTEGMRAEDGADAGNGMRRM